MKTVNEKGIVALKNWIEATTASDDFGPLCRTDEKSLDAWATEAEQSMFAGNPPIVEMSEFCTRTGKPETFTLSEDEISESEDEVSDESRSYGPWGAPRFSVGA